MALNHEEYTEVVGVSGSVDRLAYVLVDVLGLPLKLVLRQDEDDLDAAWELEEDDTLWEKIVKVGPFSLALKPMLEWERVSPHGMGLVVSLSDELAVYLWAADRGPEQPVKVLVKAYSYPFPKHVTGNDGVSPRVLEQGGTLLHRSESELWPPK